MNNLHTIDIQYNKLSTLPESIAQPNLRVSLYINIIFNWIYWLYFHLFFIIIILLFIIFINSFWIGIGSK